MSTDETDDQEIAAQAREDQAQLDEIVKETVDAATAPMVDHFALGLGLLVARWPGPADVTPELMAELLVAINLGKLVTLAGKAAGAISEGIDKSRGLALTGVSTQVRNSLELTKPKVDVVDMGKQVRTAKVLFKQATTLDQARTALTVVKSAVNTVAANASVAATEASAQAKAAVADVRGDELVWVPERDACIHCLAYAGKVRGKDGFEVGLTFGDSSPFTRALEHPPLHPHCRCDLIRVPSKKAPIIGALEREAQRSILRGFSLPTEGNAARVNAAKKLLREGVDLPASVIKYAQRAVRKGEFPNGRDVPNG